MRLKLSYDEWKSNYYVGDELLSRYPGSPTLPGPVVEVPTPRCRILRGDCGCALADNHLGECVPEKLELLPMTKDEAL